MPEMEAGLGLSMDIVAATHTWISAKRIRAMQARRKAAATSAPVPASTVGAPLVAFDREERVSTKVVRRRWRAAANAVAISRALQTFVRLRDVAAADQKRHEAERQIVLLSTVRRIYGWARRLSKEDGSVADCVKPLFKQIDADGSGQIDAHEFRLGLSQIGLQIDDRSLSVLVDHMDADGNGILDMNEFCQEMTALLEAEAASGSAILSKLCNLLSASGQTAAELFAQLDVDGSGELDATEWHQALEGLGIKVQAAAADAAMKELDMDGGSTLEVVELVDKIAEFQRKRRVFVSTVLGRVCEYIDSTNTSLVRLFARVDRDGSGDLDVVELQEALRKMGQDLSELEVEEITRELAPRELMSSRHFLDALIQFEKEREVYTAKCQKLFNEVDGDGSGHLDKNEVKILAEKLGLGEQLANPLSHLTLDGLIADIEGSRRSHESSEEEDEAEGDGKVTYEELLPWFVNEGRSFLPAPVYSTVHELEEPTEAQLLQLFESIDTDGSGEVNEEEVKEGTLARWPYLNSKLVTQAFAAADDDGSGHVAFHEFDELVRCLQFLNKQRHSLKEAMTSFRDGVGVDEFYVGLASIGVILTDKQASRYFKQECERLGVDRLTWQQFLTWVCRHECNDKNALAAQEEAAADRAKEDLETRMNNFGDIYFDDLAHVVFTSHRGGYSQEKQLGKLNKLRASSTEAIERVNALRAAIDKAISQHDSFPQLPDDVIAKLIAGTTTDVYYAGQHLTTQGRAEDTFFVLRRGVCEVLVDGESVGKLHAGDPMGEIALMYGTRRSMTVRATGPCEVFSVNRAAYETAVSILPADKRISPLLKFMELFWLLISGPDGSNRSEVDYKAYLKYHLRVSKTLTDAAEEDEYDEDEQREMALEDWEEDTKRFGLKPTGSLTQPMFFDSLVSYQHKIGSFVWPSNAALACLNARSLIIESVCACDAMIVVRQYQMVDLWSGDLDVSYMGFLRLVFENIAEWREQDDPLNKHNVAHWKFKELEDVSAQGENLDAMQDAAKAKQEAAATAKKEAADTAEAVRVEIERKDAERQQHLQHELTERKAKREREDLMVRVEEAEADMTDRVASGLISADQAAEERGRLIQGLGLQASGADASTDNGGGGGGGGGDAGDAGDDGGAGADAGGGGGGHGDGDGHNHRGSGDTGGSRGIVDSGDGRGGTKPTRASNGKGQTSKVNASGSSHSPPSSRVRHFSSACARAVLVLVR